ncbi:glutamate-5-semialdehyde dehydrogenase [Gardnerella pickettii]|uniref:Gamma-glutamyl phosphate reductase n=2 Tax=Gardnerella TaxID=2701 RepID=S4GW38_9BIFI|nr:glutamate-5-semialdehyde dehydrogenase [Gardnerella pickettii]EPI50041.1 glutamate-5-semialdehyde dehydrogenase [Gardnerella pickettii JCP7719]RFT42555.1 gamma-glutamyl-phosphate reductase [Bifidobacteriaceae bacterium N170]
MFNMINLNTKFDETHNSEQVNSSKEHGDSTDSIVFSRADDARIAQREFAKVNATFKNKLLIAIADSLEKNAEFIEKANKQDLEKAQKNGMDAGKLDRLVFNKERIVKSAQSVRKIAQLQDPVGQIVRGYTLENGIRLSQVRVPIGVMGMIYEARPNVTVDVASLCVKSSNAVILRGGSAAECTNHATVSVLKQVLKDFGVSENLIESVDDLGRSGATSMMHAHGHIDVLVPRGSANLIAAVVKESTVPVIETGAGNVHVYVDKTANFSQAIPIIINAKTQRVGVCNAAEKLLVDRSVAKDFLPKVASELANRNVLIHADEESYNILSSANISGIKLDHANNEDWSTEYLSLQIGVKVVDGVKDAINHISKYSTGHTETIIAQDYLTINEFVSSIDSAVVMVNASTRFTDGGEFGFGAELGISTQKLHARGPMGLVEMTTTKWIGYGQGQIRA